MLEQDADAGTVATAASPDGITVLLVDDHQLVRSGIRRILDDAPGIHVVADAGSGEEALALVRAHRPRVVLMDVNMPGIGGLEATRKLLLMDPDLRIIALTIHADEPYPSRLLSAGAMGYITKGCDVDEIVAAIRAVDRGERYLDTEIAAHVARERLAGQDSTDRFGALTQREVQVMLMLIRGYRLQEISDTLCLSPRTISTYRQRLYEKLDVSTDVELTHLALRHGMLEPGQ